MQIVSFALRSYAQYPEKAQRLCGWQSESVLDRMAWPAATGLWSTLIQSCAAFESLQVLLIACLEQLEVSITVWECQSHENETCNLRALCDIGDMLA
jgi:hypothetical protein